MIIFAGFMVTGCRSLLPMQIRIQESQIKAEPNPKLFGCPTPSLLSEKGLIARIRRNCEKKAYLREKTSLNPWAWNPGPPNPTVTLYVGWGITPRELGEAHNKLPNSLLTPCQGSWWRKHFSARVYRYGTVNGHVMVNTSTAHIVPF